MAESKLDELLTKTVDSKTVGGKGGKEWEDPKEILENGPITAIEVHHAGQIDSIRTFYGGVPGSQYGGTGGKKDRFEVPKDFHITKIITRAEGVVDRLEFVAVPKTGQGNDAVASNTFGGEGGEWKLVESKKGLPLRSISGREGDKNIGGRVDSLTFHFGYLYSIEDVEVDSEKLWDQVEKQMNNPEKKNLKTLDTITYDNATDRDANVTYEHSKSIELTSTARWEVESRFLAGASVKVKADVGIVSAEAALNFEFEQSFSYGQQESIAREVARSWSAEIPVQARQSTTAIVYVYEAEVKDVPFTYKVVFYEMEDGKKKEKYTVPGTAYFSGDVASSDVRISVKSEPLPPDTIETIFGQFRQRH